MLKNDIPELLVFFDLEWVPDAAGAIRLYGMPPETTEIEGMQKLWENTNGYSADNPRPFVKYLFSKVVSIAFLSRRSIYRDSERHLEFKLNSLPDLPIDANEVDEAYLIGRFLYMIGKREPQLVGFNSAESDLQVLIQRGMVNEVSAPEFNKRPNKPWEGRDYFDSRNSEWHIDLLKYFSHYAMTPRLNDLAKLCGFPGKLDVDGEQVVDLWLAGDLQSIVEYNRIDTLNTYLVWLRFVYFAGKLTEEEYAAELEDFRSFLASEAATPHGEYIKKFLNKWEM